MANDDDNETPLSRRPNVPALVRRVAGGALVAGSLMVMGCGDDDTVVGLPDPPDARMDAAEMSDAFVGVPPAADMGDDGFNGVPPAEDAGTSDADDDAFVGI